MAAAGDHPGPRSRGWCLTINNYPDGFEIMTKTMLLGTQFYGIFGREVAPTTGTPHIQAYIYSKNATTFRRIKDMFPDAHLQKANGSPAQNVAYCSKDGDYFEANEQLKPVGQGKRTDLQGLAEHARKHRSVLDLIDAGHVRSGSALRSYQRVQALVQAPRRDGLRVGWFHGASGVGKTRCAHEIMGPACFCMGNDKGWWDGYDGQRCVIIDDYNPAAITPANLLRLLDRYSCTVGGKGTSMPFCGVRIIVTSCARPEDLMGDRWIECLRRLSGLDGHGRATGDAKYIYRFDTPDPGTAWKSDKVIDASYFQAPAQDIPAAEALGEEEEDEESEL